MQKLPGPPKKSIIEKSAILRSLPKSSRSRARGVLQISIYLYYRPCRKSPVCTAYPLRPLAGADQRHPFE